MRFTTKASVAGGVLGAGLLLMAARPAEAHRDRWGYGPGYGYAPPRPYYVPPPPPPVYYAPPRVYAPSPPPPYHGPPPVAYYASPPPPAFYPPPAPGFSVGLSFR